MDKKELKKKMDKGKGSHWEKFYEAHKSLPEFAEKCLDKIEEGVKKGCKRFKPVGLPSITPKQSAFLNENKDGLDCKNPHIKKLVKIEEEATKISKMVARYEKLHTPGLPSITPGNTNDGNTTNDQKDEALAKAHAAFAIAVAQNAVEKVKEKVEEKKQQQEAKDQATKAVAVVTAYKAAEKALDLAIGKQLADLGLCLANSMNRNPASDQMSEDRRREIAESDCKDVRGKYKELLNKKAKLKEDFEERKDSI